MSGRIVVGYWDCKYCGTKGIEGTDRECPNCGHPRSENTRFCMDKNNVRYLDEEQAKSKGKGPDWLCEYCGSLNSALEYNCTSCGASKGTSKQDYFDIHGMKKEKMSGIDAAADLLETSKTISERSYDESIPRVDEDVERSLKELVEDYKSNPNRDDESFKPVDPPEKLSWIDKIFNFFFSEGFIEGCKIVGLWALMFSMVFLMVKAVLPKPIDITVNSFTWESSVEVERYETVTESDWYLPTDGRLLYTQEEIHHYDEVFSHYEQETRTYTEQVLTGYDTYYTYSDNGDGTFTEHEHSDPVYTTEIRTETVDVPVYDDVPIYETKYYYEIDKWVYNRTESASGSDKNPYYNEPVLLDNERFGTRSIRYSVICTTEEGTVTYTCSEDLWYMFEEGGTYEVAVSMGVIQSLWEDSSFSLIEEE